MLPRSLFRLCYATGAFQSVTQSPGNDNLMLTKIHLIVGQPFYSGDTPLNLFTLKFYEAALPPRL